MPNEFRVKNGLFTPSAGIGTESPQSVLDVITPASGYASFGSTLGVGAWTGIHFGYRENNTNYRKSAIVFERNDATFGDARGKVHILNGPAGSSGSATLADAKFTINELGKIGFDQTSPLYKLHITTPATGEAGDRRIQFDVADTGNSGMPALVLNRTSNASMGIQFVGGFYFNRTRTDSVNETAASIITTGSNVAGSTEGILNYNALTRHILAVNNTEVFRAQIGASVISGITNGAGGQLVIRGGTGVTSEGAQITLGYGNNSSSTITGQANNSWNIDVAAGSANNDFRIFRQASNGATVVGLQIIESSGTVTFPANVASNSTTTGTLVVTGGVGISGALNATTKSFIIDHPTKPGMKLRYGSLEGPENGVYVRGKLSGSNTIELPEYWTKLVDPDSITVNLTPIGFHQNLYVESVDDNKVVVGLNGFPEQKIDCFFTVFGERIDVDKLEVESL